MRKASDAGETLSKSVQDGFYTIIAASMRSEVVGSFGKKECVDYLYPLLGGESHVRDTGEVGIYG